MPSTVRPPIIGSVQWRRTATGILLVIGGMASLGIVLDVGTAIVPDSLAYVGAAAASVVVGSMGWSAVEPRLGSSPDRSDSRRSTAEKDGTPLELYQAEGCPYCRTVREFCTKAGISLVVHNPRTAGTMVTTGRVTNRYRHTEVIDHGKDQLPLLVDTDRDEALYESDAIIDYLERHYT